MKPPIEWVSKLSEYCAAGRVLDIGAGTGRNAFYFAKKSYDVTAVDLSLENVESMKAYGIEHRIPISIEQGDILSYKPSGKFEIVIAWHILHFLQSRGEVEAGIDLIQAATKTGGYNAVAVLMQREANNPRPYLFRDGELKDLYGEGWKVIDCSEGLSLPYSPNSNDTPIQSWVARLTAQKV
jgi:tellurite methyltransferase